MNLNIKYLLSGLTEEELNHPTVKRILESVKSNYEETGNCIGTIKWITETYNIEP